MIQTEVDFIINSTMLSYSPCQLASQSLFSYFKLVHFHWFILSTVGGCRAWNTKANCVTLLVRSGGQSLISLRIHHTAQSYTVLKQQSFFPPFPLITCEGQVVVGFFFSSFSLLSLWRLLIKSHGHAGVHARWVNCLVGHLEGGERTQQAVNRAWKQSGGWKNRRKKKI